MLQILDTVSGEKRECSEFEVRGADRGNAKDFTAISGGMMKAIG
ncbi:hypothetical protein P3W85_01300 [Cupriavidus basilensis]|uniref:Uncharacterized protein n=1 Tax=Cupriavidus basilensis TaxID=68895 RepID=A0ABT6AG72_9BURK|nr:hypothetical protein [Cupriavidus basilensis]MDF3831600.1 hypothetical protein [Cupriavidus basilensis]